MDTGLSIEWVLRECQFLSASSPVELRCLSSSWVRDWCLPLTVRGQQGV